MGETGGLSPVGGGSSTPAPSSCPTPCGPS